VQARLKNKLLKRPPVRLMDTPFSRHESPSHTVHHYKIWSPATHAHIDPPGNGLGAICCPLEEIRDTWTSPQRRPWPQTCLEGTNRPPKLSARFAAQLLKKSVTGQEERLITPLRQKDDGKSLLRRKRKGERSVL